MWNGTKLTRRKRYYKKKLIIINFKNICNHLTYNIEKDPKITMPKNLKSIFLTSNI